MGTTRFSFLDRTGGIEPLPPRAAQHGPARADRTYAPFLSAPASTPAALRPCLPASSPARTSEPLDRGACSSFLYPARRTSQDLGVPGFLLQ